MLLVDVHAHLFIVDDPEPLVQRAIKAGLKAVVENSTDITTIKKVLELSKKYEIVKPALGIYPIDTVDMSEKDFKSALKLIEKSKPIAIGEIGLDYQETEDREIQQERFEEQVKLAQKLGIAVIVHSRKAEEKVIDTLEELKAKKVVLHAFHGNMKLVKRAAKLGYVFSIPCNIKRSEHFKSLVSNVSFSNILTETDTPYLAAEKDQKSEPSHVIGTIEEIAKIKGTTAEDTSNLIFRNYQILFK